MGKSLYFIGKSLELFETLIRFLWKNLLLGKFGIGEFECQFSKFLLGNPVGNIPAQVRWEILCAMLGVVLKNVPVAKFVWNIGEILKIFYLGKLSSWDPGEPFEDTILGTLGEFWGNFYSGKV